MSKEISLFDQQASLPAHLQGFDSSVTQTLMEAVGSSLNRIGTKGSRFRQIIRGIEEGVWDENYLDVVIVGAVGSVSRRFYGASFKQTGDNAPPVCYSVDGVTPAEDVKQKQSTNCAQCPQNIKGSKLADDGTKAKACSYFRRLVVMLAGDPEGVLYRLDVTAMGLFGESHEKQQNYALNDYSKALVSRKLDAGQVVTRLSFDTDQSVPKLLFKPLRFISEGDVDTIRGIHERPDELKQYLDVSMKTVDISGEAAADEPVPEAAAAAAPARQAPPKPKPKAAAPAPAPAAAEEQEEEEEAAAPAPPKPRKAAPAAAPAPQKPAPAAAQRPAPNQPAAAKVAPAVAEVGSDDELSALLDGLDLE